MFDKKAYVKEKILTKLGKEPSYQGSNQKENTIKLIDFLDNLDMTPYKGETFEDTVIGWVAFSNSILQLIGSGQEVNLENFKNAFDMGGGKSSMVSRGTVEIDPSLLVQEDDEQKFSRLLSIVEKDDCTEDFDVDELNEEGLRARGLIGREQTELDAEDLEIDTQSQMPTIKARKGTPIISPFTNTEDIFRVSEYVFMDIETEELFRVNFI